MKVKAGRQVVELVKLCYASNTPCLLSGAHGTAKSALLEQAARELGVAFLTLDLSLLEAVDLQGVPTVRDGTTVFNPPALLPREGRGLLSLEELNRAPAEVRAPALMLLSARKLNSYVLPSGWLPVGSVNPSGESYEVHDLDPALLSRFVNVTVEADVREWLKWAEANEVHSAVMRFVESTPNVFESSNPRGWTYASSLLRAWEDAEARDEGLLAVAMSGVLGNEALGVGFTQHYLTRDEEPLLAAAILDEYEKHRGVVRRWAKERKMGCLHASTHNLLVGLQDADVAARVACRETSRANLEAFAGDVPADLARKIRKACRDAEVEL